MGSSRFWGEKEVAGRRVGEREREKETIFWLVAKRRDNIRVPGQGTEWDETEIRAAG